MDKISVGAVAGAGGEVEDVGLPLLGQTPAGGLGIGGRMGTAQVAMIGDEMTQLDQGFGKARDTQGFGAHAGATH